MRNYVILIRMSVIKQNVKKPKVATVGTNVGKTGIKVRCWWEQKKVQLLCKQMVRPWVWFPAALHHHHHRHQKKDGNRMPIASGSSIPDLQGKKTENRDTNHTYHDVHSGIIAKSPKMKTPASISRAVNK